jgi:hypothetical protein
VDAVLSLVTGIVDIWEPLIVFTGARQSVPEFPNQLCAVAATGVTSESARITEGTNTLATTMSAASLPHVDLMIVECMVAFLS